jgi:hypothetical protein
MMMQRDVSIFFEENASEHDFLAVNHFAINVRVEMFALDLIPRDVFGFGSA